MDRNMVRVELAAELAAKKLDNTINNIAVNCADIMFHEFHIRRYNVVFMVLER